MADIELKIIKEVETINEKYTPPESEPDHFVPPKLTATLWDALKFSPAYMYKHRVAFKAQSFTYTAAMPLSSVLDSIDPKDTESRNKI